MGAQFRVESKAEFSTFDNTLKNQKKITLIYEI